jgi:hypothetical protein
MERRIRIILALVAVAAAPALLGCPAGPPPAEYTATGRIETLAGGGIPGVAVTVQDEGVIAFTRADGTWSAGPLEGALTIVPLHRDWVFEPPSRTTAPGPAVIDGLDFTGRYRPVHPDTEDRPVLVFDWPRTAPFGPLNTSTGPDGHIETCRPFGHETGGPPSPDMAIVLRNRRREPVRAPCAGTVTFVRSWDDFTTAAASGGEVWLRHGVGHAVGFRHLVTDGAGLALGATVERGDVIGYTADHGEDGSVYVITAGRRTPDGPEYGNPWLWYDPLSRAMLLAVWNGAADQDAPPYADAATPWGATQRLDDAAGELAAKALL